MFLVGKPVNHEGQYSIDNTRFTLFTNNDT